MTDDEARRVAMDTEIAQSWPARWAKANDPRPGASKRRNNLRKAWQQHLAYQAFKDAHPDASCASCANRGRMPHDARMTCDLDSDFHGYSLVAPEHVCTRWRTILQEPTDAD